MARSAIINIGALVSGDLSHPTIPASSMVIENGRIAQLNSEADAAGDADLIIDAKGTTVTPSFIDSHIHMSLENYSSGHRAAGYIDLYAQAGVTTLVNASSSKMVPGPRDAATVKALALLAHRIFERVHPSGAKCLAGTLLLEPDLTEADFEELAGFGVRLAKHGFGRFAQSVDAAQHVRWAQKHGIKVMVHTGGPYRPGLHTRAADILVLRPDICMHVNGGGAAISKEEIRLLLTDTDSVLEVCQGANTKRGWETCEMARERGELGRIIVGSDSPSGIGLMPLAVFKTVVEMSSLMGLSAPEAIALATGNTARAFDLDQGIIEVGRPADLMIIDKPSGADMHDALGSIEDGDIPGISAVLIDGIVRAFPSRVAGSPDRSATLTIKTLAGAECVRAETS